MQEEDLRLRGLRVGALPILNHFIERMGLAQELTLALKNCDYADALIGLSKNILIDRNALYAVGEWAALYDSGLVAQGKMGDDESGHQIEAPATGGPAPLQTRIVLAAMKSFGLGMRHGATVCPGALGGGRDDGQNAKAVLLK